MLCVYPYWPHMLLIWGFKVLNPLKTWFVISRCVSGSLDVLKMRFGVVLKCFGVFPRSKNCPTKFDFVQQKLAVYQKKLRGHIGFGLSVQWCAVSLSVMRE